MSSSAVVAAQSAGPHATFDDLRLGRSTQFIVGRILSFRDSSNIKKNGEFMAITRWKGIYIQSFTSMITSEFLDGEWKIYKKKQSPLGLYVRF